MPDPPVPAASLEQRLRAVAEASEQWAGYGNPTLSMSHAELSALLRGAADALAAQRAALQQLRDLGRQWLSQADSSWPLGECAAEIDSILAVLSAAPEGER